MENNELSTATEVSLQDEAVLESKLVETAKPSIASGNEPLDPVSVAAKKKQREQLIKYALAGTLFTAVIGAAAYGVLSGEPENAKKISVDTTGVVQPKNPAVALSAEETARRAQADAQDANAARNKEASFASNTTTGTINQNPNASFGIAPASTNPAPIDITGNMTGARPPAYPQGGLYGAPQQPLPDPNKGVNATLESNEKAVTTSIDKYFDFFTKSYLETEKAAKTSGYQRVAYSKNTSGAEAQQASLTAAPPQPIAVTTNSAPAIRAGSAMYAILNTSINTDSGMSDVIATVIGGEYNGARILGSIKKGQGNFALLFHTLAPQDGRPSIAVNAVALRAEDMSQGMADSINNHTFSRYTSLAVASLLSGYGKTASTLSGTTTLSDTATVITTEAPTNRQIIAGALGELGNTAATELRRGYDRQPTYKTNAGAQFVVFFMRDSSTTN